MKKGQKYSVASHNADEVIIFFLSISMNIMIKKLNLLKIK